MIDYGVIIQARLSSSRLPEKVSKWMINGEMLFHQIERLKKGGVDHIFIATSTNEQDNPIVEIAKKSNVDVFRGSLNDVLSRYCEAANYWNIKNVIRVGGDDPLIDPNGILSLIRAHKDKSSSLIYSSHKNGWIYGTAAELIETNSLVYCQTKVTSSSEKEHLVSFMINNPAFKQYKISPIKKEQRSDIYLSVDYQEDIELVEEILRHFHKRGMLHAFSQSDLIELYDSGKLTIKNKHLHAGFEE